MKTQTSDKIFAILLNIENGFTGADNSIDNVMEYVNDHTTTQIEALRERLINDILQLVTVQKINSIVNEFLKEINDGKNID